MKNLQWTTEDYKSSKHFSVIRFYGDAVSFIVLELFHNFVMKSPEISF